MRTYLAAVVIFAALFTASTFAVFDVGTTETFNPGLTGWTTGGDVALGSQGDNSFAQLGRRTANNNSKMVCYFVAPTTGEYEFSFDYKYSGTSGVPQNVSAGISDDSGNVYAFQPASRGSGWRTVNSQPISLKAGQKYAVSFGLNESIVGKRRLARSTMNVDNVNVSLTRPIPIPPPTSVQTPASRVSAVPAPGAILLAAVGAALVGWLRNRKTL